jgi:hypothetical protein
MRKHARCLTHGQRLRLLFVLPPKSCCLTLMPMRAFRHARGQRLPFSCMLVRCCFLHMRCCPLCYLRMWCQLLPAATWCSRQLPFHGLLYRLAAVLSHLNKTDTMFSSGMHLPHCLLTLDGVPYIGPVSHMRCLLVLCALPLPLHLV